MKSLLREQFLYSVQQQPLETANRKEDIDSKTLGPAWRKDSSYFISVLKTSLKSKCLTSFSNLPPLFEKFTWWTRATLAMELEWIWRLFKQAAKEREAHRQSDCQSERYSKYVRLSVSVFLSQRPLSRGKKVAAYVVSPLSVT